MAKFEVCITETIERAKRVTINITKKQVVDALGLEGDDAKEWKEHLVDYVQQEWEEIKNRDEPEEGEVEENDISYEVEHVTPLDE